MKKLLSKIFDNKKQETKTATQPRGFIDFATGKRVEIINGREVFVD